MAAATEPPPSGRERNVALDLLRGLVMVIMALDHARDFFSDHAADPTMDLATTTPALFFTRWITHFCAPVFVFLAGTSAFLAGTRRTRPQLARFLVTRGVWLLIVAVTLVRWGWFFHLGFQLVVIEVIWTIGASMIILAGLVFLPVRAVGMIGLALVLWSSATTCSTGSARPIWGRGAGCGSCCTSAGSSRSPAAW
jgi:uncharacterized membrane protein